MGSESGYVDTRRGAGRWRSRLGIPGLGRVVLIVWAASMAREAGSQTVTTAPADSGAFTIPMPADMEALEPAVRQAIEKAVAAVRATPEDDRAVGRLGILYQANMFKELAVPCYRRARELAAHRPQWRYFLGAGARAIGDSETARRELSSLVKAGIEYPPALYHLGELMLEAGEVDAAAGMFERMIAVAPQDAGGYFGSGRVEMQRGNYERAAELFERARGLAPTSEDVLQQLGLAYRRLARIKKSDALKDQAREFLQAARNAEEVVLYRDPWSGEMGRVEVSTAQLGARARSLLSQGRAAQAAEVLVEAVRRQPESAVLLRQLADVRHRQGDKAEALRLSEKVVELSPNNATYWGALAELRRVNRQTAGALEAVDHCLALGPGELPAKFLRGRILLELGRLEEAVEELQAVVAAEPDHVHATVRLADALLQLQRNEEALPIAERAVELDKNSGYAHFELGVALARAGELERSEKELRLALELKPTSEAVRIHLDWVVRESTAAKSVDSVPAEGSQK